MSYQTDEKPLKTEEQLEGVKTQVKNSENKFNNMNDFENDNANVNMSNASENSDNSNISKKPRTAKVADGSIVSNPTDTDSNNNNKNNNNNNVIPNANNGNNGNNDHDASNNENGNAVNNQSLFIGIIVLFFAIIVSKLFGGGGGGSTINDSNNLDAPFGIELPSIECPDSYHAVPNSDPSYKIQSIQPFELIDNNGKNNNNNNNNIKIQNRWKILSIDKINTTLDKYIMITGHKTSQLTFEGYSINSEAVGKIEIELDISITNGQNSKEKTCPITVEIIAQPILGIDLGTTYSCVAYQLPCDYQENNKLKLKTSIVDITNGEYCIPTAVYFSKDGNILYGDKALEYLATDAENVIYDIKRIIGREKHDVEVSLFKKTHAFKLATEGEHFNIIIPNRKNQILTPEQIMALILQYLVKIASQHLGIPYVRDVVISVPAYYHNGQRQATRSACHIASLNPKNLVIEPSSAAIAHKYYSSDTIAQNYETFMTFDFGGGTLDCTVMNCAGIECLVISVEGDSSLGGIDFDHVLIDIIIKKLGYHPSNMSKDDKAKYKKIAEKTKKALSKEKTWTTDPLLNSKGDMVPITITRSEFEKDSQSKRLVSRAMAVVDRVMNIKDIHIDQDINPTMILMIGGTSNMPMIKNALLKKFDSKQIVFPDFDPQLMVVQGTAFIGASIAYYTKFSNKYDCTHADIVSISNAIPLAIGFAVCQGDTDTTCNTMAIMVKKNTNYPISTTKTFCQHIETQTETLFRLYEGDFMNADENYLLGTLRVTDIPIRLKHECDTINVKFEINNDGIATITATINEKYYTYANKHKQKVFIANVDVATDSGSLNEKQLKIQRDEVLALLPEANIRKFVSQMNEKEGIAVDSNILKQ